MVGRNESDALTGNEISLRFPRASHNISLIRSITRLLNTILNKQDRNIRPMNDKKGEPLLVEVDINVRSMGPISEQKMEFSLDCYFRQKWLDRRLAFVPIDDRDEIPLSSQMLKDIWVPDTYIRNGRRSYLHTLTVPNILFRVNSQGFVHVSQRLTIRTRCQMYLAKFPMDSQACPIEIGSFGYFTSDVIYKWKNVDLDDKMGNMLSQYKLLNIAKTQMNLSDYRYPNKESSVLKVYFKLQRQQGFYILQIYTPCTLLVVMSWVSFWINKEASPARVALGIMTVLSMSTLGFGLRTDLPKVSHPTALDIYIIVCFGFVFAALVEYAVINYAHVYYIRKKVKELQGLESNRAIEKMRMFTAGIMGARRETLQDTQMEELSVPEEREPWYRCFRKKQENHSVFYRMAVKAAKARRKLQMSDPAAVVNRIDSVSKLAFPISYIVFNLVYWIAFLHWIPDEINELLDTVKE
ncbi:unnamed protein product, partial [Mesorhabditis belari]|uniref:Uncharacterized protein n=1 Tax=Mesorhabditis belari TaxID=2138241 RepID=A0AAF3E9T9_9BILA